jgi:hypothetical protein
VYSICDPFPVIVAQHVEIVCGIGVFDAIAWRIMVNSLESRTFDRDI